MLSALYTMYYDVHFFRRQIEGHTGAAGILNMGNLNLRVIILSTEAIQTTKSIINCAEQIQNNNVSL